MGEGLKPASVYSTVTVWGAGAVTGGVIVPASDVAGVSVVVVVVDGVGLLKPKNARPITITIITTTIIHIVDVLIKSMNYIY